MMMVYVVMIIDICNNDSICNKIFIYHHYAIIVILIIVTSYCLFYKNLLRNLRPRPINPFSPKEKMRKNWALRMWERSLFRGQKF